MKHECGLCLRDNHVCIDKRSFLEILFGKVKNCMLYDDYHKGLEKKQKRRDIQTKIEKRRKEILLDSIQEDIEAL